MSVRPKAPCKIEHCTLPAWGRGWCNAHYHRWYRNGDPLADRRREGKVRLYTVEDINWDVLPHDQARACLARYLTGEPLADLAAEFGVSTHAVQGWLTRSKKTSARVDGKPLPRDELRRLLEADWPRGDVAVHFNCSETHVRNETTRLGLAPVMACRLADWHAVQARGKAERLAAQREAAESKREERRARNARIVADYQAGDVLYTLAIRYNVDGALVWRVLRAAGVDTTQRKGRGRYGWAPSAEAMS